MQDAFLRLLEVEGAGVDDSVLFLLEVAVENPQCISAEHLTSAI